MSIMTKNDYYQITVYPKGHTIVLRFVGDCWDKYNWEMTYNTYVAPLVLHYSGQFMTWGDRIELTHGYYVWAWEPRALDIKGDG